MRIPCGLRRNNWQKITESVEELSALGMRAIEVYHSDHSPEGVSFYRSLAERFHLAMTGGSDFHGANKPSISLGTGIRGNLNVPDSLLEGLRLAAGCGKPADAVPGKLSGGHGQIRTADLSLRRRPLYPSELRARYQSSIVASAGPFWPMSLR